MEITNSLHLYYADIITPMFIGKIYVIGVVDIS